MINPIPAYQELTITQNNEMIIDREAINGCTNKTFWNVSFIFDAQLETNEYLMENVFWSKELEKSEFPDEIWFLCILDGSRKFWIKIEFGQKFVRPIMSCLTMIQ